MRWRRLGIAVLAAALQMVFAAGLCLSEDAPATTSLSVHFTYDADSCPVSAGIFLDETADTIGGFELVLLLNRPDVLRFKMKRTTAPKLLESDDSTPVDSVLAPVLFTDSGLVREWAYVECRGNMGHMARVIGIAELIDPKPAPVITPGAHGLLFEIPLERATEHTGPADSDSLSLEIQPNVSRLSTMSGHLVHNVTFTPAQADIHPCRR